MRILLLLSIFLQSFSLHAEEKPLILITYYSPSGHTQQLAEAIAAGAASNPHVRIKLCSIDQVGEQELREAAAIILGSPVYNANIAPPVQEFINAWPFEGRPFKNKIGAAFVTGGGISLGEELVMLNLLHSMLIHGMILVGGESLEASFGASAVTGEGPFQSGFIDPIFVEKGIGLGKRIAELTLKLQN